MQCGKGFPLDTSRSFSTDAALVGHSRNDERHRRSRLHDLLECTQRNALIWLLRFGASDLALAIQRRFAVSFHAGRRHMRRLDSLLVVRPGWHGEDACRCSLNRNHRISHVVRRTLPIDIRSPLSVREAVEEVSDAREYRQRTVVDRNKVKPKWLLAILSNCYPQNTRTGSQ